MFCQFKDIFGKPFTGLHQYRIWIGNYDFAIIDIILTMIGAVIITYFTEWHYLYTFTGLFILGIILHRLFCVKTSLDQLLF